MGFEFEAKFKREEDDICWSVPRILTLSAKAGSFCLHAQDEGTWNGDRKYGLEDIKIDLLYSGWKFIEKKKILEFTENTALYALKIEDDQKSWNKLPEYIKGVEIYYKCKKLKCQMKGVDGPEECFFEYNTSKEVFTARSAS